MLAVIVGARIQEYQGGGRYGGDEQYSIWLMASRPSRIGIGLTRVGSSSTSEDWAQDG